MKTISKAMVLPALAAMAVTMVNVPVASARTDAAPLATDLNMSSAPITDLSAARKARRAVSRHVVRRHRGDAAAAAMFGMVAGTIAQIAAAEAYRDQARTVYYYDDGYGYYGNPGVIYARPRYHHRQSYSAPVVRHHYHGAPQYNAPQYVPQVRHWEGPGGR